MKSRATSPAKMSLVNLVKNLTRVDPSKKATERAMTKVQRPIQNLQGRKRPGRWERVKTKRLSS